MATAPDTKTPSPPAAETIEERFRPLAAAWRDFASSYPRNPMRYDHPAYQEIIRMGLVVIPVLLRALAEYPKDWFWALHVITGADPVATEERDSPGGMRSAWLRWGREHGFLPQSSDTINPTANGADQYAPDTASCNASVTETLETRFRRLTSIWRTETAHLSSSTAIANHPALQEIIHLGPSAVPLILRELEQANDHWFSALRALTGADPTAPADCGKIDRIAAAWLKWGREHGYRW